MDWLLCEMSHLFVSPRVVESCFKQFVHDIILLTMSPTIDPTSRLSKQATLRPIPSPAHEQSWWSDANSFLVGVNSPSRSLKFVTCACSFCWHKVCYSISNNNSFCWDTVCGYQIKRSVCLYVCIDTALVCRAW